MKLYNVDLDCPRCGKRHGVYGGLWGGLVNPNGPDHAGTIAELYGGQELPGVLVRLMNDTPRVHRGSLDPRIHVRVSRWGHSDAATT